MLDIMRKHASSWGIKAILGMIILSFVLFFGYSRISSVRRPSVRGGDNQNAVAVVNHMAIPESEFRYFYDAAYERMREQFKDKEVPDFARNMIEQSTLSQLIRRELLLQIADKLGIKVTDQELAEAIRQSQIAMRGQFDPDFYTHQYLPYFENRFGINFEDMLRNDLRAGEVQKLFLPVAHAATKPGEEAAEKPEKETVTAWTFEIVTLDASEQAHKVARKFADNPTNGLWKQLAKKHDAKLERVEEVTIKDRRAKLKGFNFDQYSAIFSLSEDTPVVDNPIAKDDNTISIVRLIERKQIEKDITPSKDDFFQQWMTQMAARSKIRTYLDDQNQARKK
jgi:hypothetical protein